MRRSGLDSPRWGNYRPRTLKQHTLRCNRRRPSGHQKYTSHYKCRRWSTQNQLGGQYRTQGLGTRCHSVRHPRNPRPYSFHRSHNSPRSSRGSRACRCHRRGSLCYLLESNSQSRLRRPGRSRVAWVSHISWPGLIVASRAHVMKRCKPRAFKLHLGRAGSPSSRSRRSCSGGARNPHSVHRIRAAGKNRFP